MRTLFFLALCAGIACQTTPSSPDLPALTVQVPTELREQPDEKSRELLRLPVGAALLDRGETSRFLATVYLDDILRQEPWLRVQTPKGQVGWVFAGAVRPTDRAAAAELQWTADKRAQALFGSDVAGRLRDWAAQPDAATDSVFAAHLRTGLHLRDTLNRLLAYAVSRDAALAPADLSWLAEPMRYFGLQPYPAPHLALDYRLVARAAARTAGQQDDLFAQIGLAAFPLDSMESPLPAWVFPLNIDASCSNLGAGHHLELLKKIEQALKNGNLLRSELLYLKDRILADILDQSRAYWQSQEKILAELDQVLSADLACITDRDRLALTARRAMFMALRENGIQANLRAGM